VCVDALGVTELAVIPQAS